jgi:hypothetical protein
MVKRAHAAIFAAENGYRGNRFSLEETLDDTISTAAMICQVSLKGSIPDERAGILMNGISRIRSHLVGAPYRIDDAKVSAAKAAYLAGILKRETITVAIEKIRFSQNNFEELRDGIIERWPVLNRLKALNTEAFYYWKALEELE